MSKQTAWERYLAALEEGNQHDIDLCMQVMAQWANCH